MKIYGDLQSGNCYKVKLLLTLLQLPFEWQNVDILNGECHTAEFLALNPNGKIPVMVLDSGECLSESNAILNYLAAGTPFLPDDPLARAKVLQWQFFEQYSHEPYIAVARYIAKYLGLPADRITEYESKRSGGYAALKVMEQHLAAHDYFVGNTLTIADISLYSYTHVAHEGGFDLADYPAVKGWINRVESAPNYIGLGI